jgi:hypothetical protein
MVQADLSPAQVKKLIAETQKTLTSQKWRLNNLYRIEDKDGIVIPFRMNDAQEQFFREMGHRNTILKCRQLGFSTLIALLMLDICVFHPNVNAGIVDHTIDDAKKKLRKAKFAYEGLPDWVKAENPLVSANAFELIWKNGSVFDVGTSHRGGTKQYLHVSEMGKTAIKTPEKAREIITGAFNAVPRDGQIFVESTAEGQSGSFFTMCKTAEGKKHARAKMTPLDFNFHFYPWHQAKEYTIDPVGVPIPAEMDRYFSDLARIHGIQTTAGQRAWYVKMAEVMLDDMAREYPSYPDEAFAAKIKGSIFGDQMAAAGRKGAIGAFKAHPGVPVHTFWDIGRSDYTSIWFVQVFAGKLRVVGFYQQCMEAMPHYAAFVFGSKAAREKFPEYAFSEEFPVGIFAKNGWTKGIDVFPHDGKVMEWGSGRTRIEQLQSIGFNPKMSVEMTIHDGINAGRATIGYCEFDQEGCGDGLRVLREYRWKWDDKRGIYLSGTPDHNDASHGADAWRYLSATWREMPTELEPQEIEEIKAVARKAAIANFVRQRTFEELEAEDEADEVSA